MQSHLTHLRRCMLLLLLLSCGGSVYAQTFEYFVSNAATDEDGRFGITKLANNGGYVAAGTIVGTVAGCETAGDAIVTKFNLNGVTAAGWPKVYHIGDDCEIDSGKCIIECRFVAATAGDYIVLGRTTSMGVEDCSNSSVNTFLMSLAANGNVNWVRIYPDVHGERVVEAKNGNGAADPGDLIFCGTTVGDEPFIARVRGVGANAGAVIWEHVYSLGSSTTGIFFDVIECQNMAGQGHVAAAGTINGLATIIRVSGNTGGIAAAPHGVGQYGAVDSSAVLRSLQELRVGANAGDLVACGDEFNNDIYVIQTAPDPCTFVADVTHTAGIEEEAWAIREIIPPASSALTAGNLVITGYTIASAGANPDVFLLELIPGTLARAPFPSTGFHIYDAAGVDGADFGFSVSPVYRLAAMGAPTDGFIFCGFSDRSAAALGNEMYIVKTNRVGRESPACDDDTLATLTTNPGYDVNCEDADTLDATMRCYGEAHIREVSSLRTCFLAAKPAMPGDEPVVGEGLTLTTIPNPVRRGSDFTLTIATGKESPAVVKIADISGEIVATLDETLRAGESLLTVHTKGWAAGTYIVTVTAGDRTTAARIVVE